MKVLCSGEVYMAPIFSSACLECAYETGAPPCGYSYPLLLAIFKSQEGDRRDEIHVSDINKCLLSAYMAKVNPRPEYVHKLLVLFLGIAVHDAIERAVSSDAAEVPVSNGDGLMGRIDYIDNLQLLDIKTTRWLKTDRLPYGNHKTQVNIYNLLSGNNRDLRIQYIDMSGPPMCRKCRIVMEMQSGVVRCPSCGYVNGERHLGAAIVGVEQDDPTLLEAWVDERTAILKNALRYEIIPDPEPGWGCNYCAYLECAHNKNGGQNGNH